MRVWDLAPGLLCRQHLLAEHHEIHAIWSIITQNKKGYRQHPEVKRWQGKLKALFLRHEKVVKEMKKRDYSHRSDLDQSLAKGKGRQDQYVDTLEKQKQILTQKHCQCLL